MFDVKFTNGSCSRVRLQLQHLVGQSCFLSVGVYTQITLHEQTSLVTTIVIRMYMKIFIVFSIADDQLLISLVHVLYAVVQTVPNFYCLYS